MFHAMIMAGGGGTRFWPRSRRERPKQFLRFGGDRTLLQGTFDRIAPVVPADRTWVVTGAAYEAETVEQLPELPRNHVVGEPTGRDTAACVGLGAALVAKADPDATLIVMPADHVIEPAAEFQRAALAAEQVLADDPGVLVTFGIPPTYPATGYGYIHRGEGAGSRQGVPVSRVKGFKEKPKFPVAEEYVASGNYFWNSGIFVWKAKTILAELRERKPELCSAVERIAAAWGTPQQADVFRAEYAAAEKVSIDFAVMQDAAAAGKVRVVHAPFQWDDVGSWLALERRNPQDADGNTVQALHVGIDTKDCVVVSDTGHLIATIGVSDLLIVQDGNATLVASRKNEEAVKQIVDRLKAAEMDRYL